nr:family 10 glycosylhydrolase [Deltaproteobacteria bacterium]
MILVGLGSCLWSPEPLRDPVALGDAPPLVEVAAPREFRGVWVATVANINFPTRPGLSPAALTAELDRIVDASADAGFNAIVFQVRPEGDALYDSEMEPWSRFLTGRQGGDPGMDPLAYLVSAAHARNVEVHAWFNPYRAKSSASAAAVAPHITVSDPDLVRTYGNLVWMDPGSERVRKRTLDVVLDVAKRYDVDGIHFDDYFYPYPDASGRDFPDTKTWDVYVGGGGMLERADWRRSNVNALVSAVGDGLASTRSWVRFGISPFGIYRPGFPDGVTGFDQYARLYADPLTWLEHGWVDYVAPQLYWPTSAARQPYNPLLTWWAERSSGGRHVFAGNFLAALGTKPHWTVDEFRLQLEGTRVAQKMGATGNIFYHIGPILTNQAGVADV